MILTGETTCPICGGNLRYYDSVNRRVKRKGGVTDILQLRRFRCEQCKRTHREIVADIFPYRQYEREIVVGVLEGYITSETLGFEDFPCEETMLRWRKKKRNLHLFL